MVIFAKRSYVVKINLSKLSVEVLIARKEVSLQYAHTMLWMAKMYQQQGIVEGMRYCAQRGIESIKEHQRVSAYIERNKIVHVFEAA